LNQNKLHIVNSAHQLFIRYGYKSVTVDEIAKQAGISKKTLYETFADKDAIVDASLNMFENQIHEQELLITNSSSSAIDEAMGHLMFLEQTLRLMNRNCITDLQRFYPSSFKIFIKQKQHHINTVVNNIKRGIKEGVYRKGINVELAAWSRIEHMFYMLESMDFSKKFDVIEAQIESMQLFLYSISTLKGHELIEQYFNKTKKKK
jgi:TetR/AcrR family transcriptional regulator, cholesterol catabolism regulator